MVLGTLLSPVSYRAATRGSDDPWRSMQRVMQQALDDVLTQSPTSPLQAAAIPLRLDVKEDEKAFHVTTDLPGLDENEVDVTFEDGVLTIRGEKKIERDEKKDTWHITERSYGSFARQLVLPATINSDQIEAKFDKGVLAITLPKASPDKNATKKITIKTKS